MINILIKTHNNVVIYILANGHAQGNGYVNIVCSSFSFILRTFLSILDYEEENFIVDNSLRGYLKFEASFGNLNKQSLFYYSRFFIQGVKDLCFEYPYDIKLILEETSGNK
ncbi:ribosomal-processing cysteine protease Prp [Borrelia miyamotoi]|uniref:Ribosomal-processing cysteine protease Prp n=1 Tax=Borrelia miyamotoi TaxID=47466 RepID=A0AAX3JLG5_9SPIR|nr:ribosomal-processing cysteine protease Prp [Borrelia miyamotoi]QFP41602.1 ribosomal-processing cysteine protease Prp [Borrelia miyamotoi]QFP47722.1 ribosomal-processing cysteine protease Prp [Borrelia miyamotoi]QGT55484.1 ribosomal-processing cysteine protease Prp [Borrelia miyamotoi]QGT56265.1 ribosomal-processing cysteine protease Prp [Borrelia miyamotoi]WAZ71509.1 ribosomal-processing cysteine protease Prp [Borrelia miyamotoi]